MNDRLDTLTEQTFRLSDKVRTLETNVVLLGGLCAVMGFLLVIEKAKRV